LYRKPKIIDGHENLTGVTSKLNQMGANGIMRGLTTTSLRKAGAAHQLNQMGAKARNLLASTSIHSFLRPAKPFPNVEKGCVDMCEESRLGSFLEDNYQVSPRTRVVLAGSLLPGSRSISDERGT